MEELSIPELVSSLRSSFQKADFDRVEKILVEREESVAAAVKSNFSEVLSLKEVEKIELEAKCEDLLKEVEGLRSQSAQQEERAKKAEEEFRAFFVEQENKRREAMDVKALVEARVSHLALEKSAVDRKAEKYKDLCRKLEQQVLTVEEEQNVVSLRVREALSRIEEMKKREQDYMEKFLKLQAENRNLECSLKRVETDAMDWKKKYGELEALSLRLVEEHLSLKAKCQAMSQKTEYKNGSNLPSSSKSNGDEICEGIESRRISKLEVEDSDRKVDGVVRSGVGLVPEAVIEIMDSEDEMELKESGCLKQNIAETLGNNGDIGAKKFLSELHLNLKIDGAALVDGANYRENVISTSTPKRKRSSRVIMSDSDSLEDEDRTPDEEVKRSKIIETKVSLSSSRNCSPASSYSADGNQELKTPSRRRPVPLSQCTGVKDRGNTISPRDSATPILSPTSRDNAVARDKGTVFCKLHYPVEDVKDHETCEDEDVKLVESDSEGESLGGFIVDEPNASDNEVSSNDTSDKAASSDSSIDQIFARIRRGKCCVKWEYEADMLASFGKDPVICMKAVCALYRQQTADEQSVQGTLFMNNRGFSKLDARRGSSIAEFLTDGNPGGPLTKSVKDLQGYDPTGVECCYKLATHYSKQLFMIYQNKEDPYFLPTT